jgi:hypothetical protein
MTRSLDDFEVRSAQRIAAFIEMPMPLATWQTPDGKIWTPQQVLRGWSGRSSDHWAWRVLHAWIMKDAVAVQHVELPVGYQQPGDAAWQFVSKLGNGTFEREPHGAMGRADMLVHYDEDDLGLFVEFGTCTPAKFVFNLGVTVNDWMLVPGGQCSYGFVFTPLKPPLLRVTNFEAALKPLASSLLHGDSR